MRITTVQDRQIINELSLLNYNKLFTKLTQQQKHKVIQEFILIKRKLKPGQEEVYLSQKMFYKKKKRKKIRKKTTLQKIDKFMKYVAK